MQNSWYARAKRGIYTTTPIQQGQPFGSHPKSEIPRETLYEIRRVNAGVSDEQFEQFLAERRSSGKPWSMNAQRKFAESLKEPKEQPKRETPDTASASETTDTDTDVRAFIEGLDVIDEIGEGDNEPAKPAPAQGQETEQRATAGYVVEQEQDDDSEIPPLPNFFEPVKGIVAFGNLCKFWNDVGRALNNYKKQLSPEQRQKVKAWIDFKLSEMD